LSDIQYVYPLIHNKVTSPHYVTPTLRRARLMDWLHGNAECRAVVIAADAGYGKTTLLWQWEREVAFPCYWYKLDRNDRDWSLHISYLIESISQRHAGFGRRAHSMLEQLGGPGSSRPGVAAYLLAEMHERLTEPCTFIIDDWHYVASVTEVRGLWNQILRDAPPTCRFIFLSRAKPHLQFARFKTHGGYAEMRTDALRFNDREIEELFRDIYNDPLDPTELAELERRTEGWAASLQLVEVSLRERHTPEERRSFIQSITATRDSDLFEFLAQEVLDQQDDRIRNFLLSTSILRQVVPELAERLAGVHDGTQMLGELEQRGLFTYRLDSADRFRYHGLFREFLERKLELDRSEGEVAGLHIHAASFYETHEEWPEAIHHYLRARLHPQAARLIARFGEDVAAEARLGLVDEWLQQLPPKTIRENARLCLLSGEALGIRGDWDAAIAALAKAETYFARKGDRRMQALTKLKLSTVLASLGRVEAAAQQARSGLELAPPDALAIQLRLRGNLAITASWLGSPFQEVIDEFRRIVVEAKSRGWEHFAAIGLHNLGVALRHVGRIEESIRSLELAARFWSDLPASPFADNAELVASLLAGGQVGRAEEIASTAVVRTDPWPRPRAEAVYGQALVLAYRGRFKEAVDSLELLLADAGPLGATADLVAALLSECLFLAGQATTNAARLERLLPDKTDPRLEPVVAVARAIAVHVEECVGECLEEGALVKSWEARGANFTAASSLVKIASLGLEHRGKAHERLAVTAIQQALGVGALGALRWWLRRYTPYATQLAKADGGDVLLAALCDADPEGWRDALVDVLPEVAGVTRERILTSLGKHATKSVVDRLRSVPGPDVAEVRRLLRHRHAPRLHIRTFGSLVVHRTSWAGPPITVDKRRTRMLLGLLAANLNTALTRDAVLDIMWPDADPGLAVNSLNQTVFQLRRLIEPNYRDGESAQYVISNVDIVQLNPELVTTDLAEFRRLAATHRTAGMGEVEGRLVSLVKGQFLTELRYEDWAGRLQTAIHAEVREHLLPVATGQHGSSPDLSIRAAAALLELDEFDDQAYAAMAVHLERSGRRAAARMVLQRYATKIEEELAEEPSPEIATLLGALNARQDMVQ
jgi:DNA-binding SARP family transcriptional activator/tetratricopeptide (TPR) repeat protein